MRNQHIVDATLRGKHVYVGRDVYTDCLPLGTFTVDPNLPPLGWTVVRRPIPPTPGLYTQTGRSIPPDAPRQHHHIPRASAIHAALAARMVLAEHRMTDAEVAMAERDCTPGEDELLFRKGDDLRVLYRARRAGLDARPPITATMAEIIGLPRTPPPTEPTDDHPVHP